MRKANKRFRQFFEWKGLTQDNLAPVLGCGQTTISHLLNGVHGANTPLAVAIERLSAEWPEGPILVEEWADRDEG
jgi:hypothetical protein